MPTIVESSKLRASELMLHLFIHRGVCPLVASTLFYTPYSAHNAVAKVTRLAAVFCSQQSPKCTGKSENLLLSFACLT